MILIDVNVVLDVLQRREPHYPASASVLDRALRDSISAALPAHAITTVHYVVARYQDGATADRAVSWLLRYFQIVAIGRDDLLQALALDWPDFEDAVVATAARAAGCTAIITRNVRDFAGSAVPALTPEEYLIELEQT